MSSGIRLPGFKSWLCCFAMTISSRTVDKNGTFFIGACKDVIFQREILAKRASDVNLVSVGGWDEGRRERKKKVTESEGKRKGRRILYSAPEYKRVMQVKCKSKAYFPAGYIAFSVY